MHSCSLWWKKQRVRTPLQVQEEGKAVSKEIQKKKNMKETKGYTIKIHENFTIVTITALRFGLQYASRKPKAVLQTAEIQKNWKAEKHHSNQ